MVQSEKNAIVSLHDKLSPKRLDFNPPALFRVVEKIRFGYFNFHSTSIFQTVLTLSM